jgi:hypothetical protein
VDSNARENQVLNEALNALAQVVGINAKILPLPNKKNLRYDALLELRLNGHRERFVVETKKVDRHIAVAQIKEQLQALIQAEYENYLPLLITAFMTPDLADQCRKLGLAFIDTAGNLAAPTAAGAEETKGTIL